MTKDEVAFLAQIKILLAKVDRLTAELAARTEERDGLAVIVELIRPHAKEMSVHVPGRGTMPFRDVVDACGAHAILAARDTRVKAEGRAEGLREIQRQCKLGLDSYMVYQMIDRLLAQAKGEADARRLAAASSIVREEENHVAARAKDAPADGTAEANTRKGLLSNQGRLSGESLPSSTQQEPD
jgi:hypothetical protein